MTDNPNAFLIKVDGTIEPLTLDQKNFREGVREALGKEPAVQEGVDLSWGTTFTQDPYIHGQGEVNALATYSVQQFSGERIYVFGDAVFCATTPDGEPRPLIDFVRKPVARSLEVFKKGLEGNPALRASIEKLEDVRPDEEKQATPE